MNEEVEEGYTDWISPFHDHARMSYTIGDSSWGNIPETKLAPTPQCRHEKYKVDRIIIPHLPMVDRICTPLAAEILEQHVQGRLSINEGSNR